MGNPPHLLHVFPNFGAGGAQMTILLTVNKLGGKFRHSFLAVDGDYSAMERLDPGIDARRVEAPPRRGPFQYPMSMRRIAREVAPDLICTYNWGASDMLLGARLGTRCPFVHNEHGFGDDEADALKWRRVWARRLILLTIHATVVPSETLLRIARKQYRLPEAKIRYIKNKIDTDRFHLGRADIIRGKYGVGRDEVLFGFIGALRPEKNISFLIESFLKSGVGKLMIVGDGVCRPELERIAAGSVIFAGNCPDTPEYYRAFDVFCMSSITEQRSIALLEAMSSGLPCITTDVGDSASLLGRPGFPQVVRLGDGGEYADALRRLATDKALREQSGRANRELAVEKYSHESMVEEYEKLWREAIENWRKHA
jgi:glycosyltransferase involved in cell wall biosynthesis